MYNLVEKTFKERYNVPAYKQKGDDRMFTIQNVRKQANLQLAYHRLITNPESTYKNYFRDVYNGYAMALDDNLKNIGQRLKAGYMPDTSIRVFMPKSNGLSRMYTLLSMEDQIVYQAFANIIAEAISTEKTKRRYKKSVFGNLLTDKTNIFFYQPWQESYKAYTKAVIRAYQAGQEYIASFDLTACYDSINHSLLKKILIGYQLSENCASEFIRLIEKWESSSGLMLGTGIPQGPQASGVVAEVVLSEYDAYIETLQKKYDFKYFRYVDDIRILSSNEDTVKWILFLLDKKSKELGLFPQSAKIAVHKITNIDDEVKRISKPLFDDEFDNASKKSECARRSIISLLKKDPVDLTSIKRYFHFVQHSSKTNKMAITAVTKFPNMIHSFAYYILRYPRKLPHSITNYVYECCQDKTKQFSAGILLDAIVANIDDNDCARFAALCKNLLKANKKSPFIVDCRFKAQLLLFVILYGHITLKTAIKRILSEESWWTKKELLSQLQRHERIDITQGLMHQCLCAECSDISLVAANIVLLDPAQFHLPPIHEINPLAQNTLKCAGIIHRSKYSNSQINRYLAEITGKQRTFSWKKYLGKEHDQLELNIFKAHCYWKTDLTAFVNLWDTIDDRICSVLTSAHTELGGYSLGNVGGIENSTGFMTHLPTFYKMVINVHKLRLMSHLSHSKVKRTNNYTGPIPQKERRKILKLINEGIDELIAYW